MDEVPTRDDPIWRTYRRPPLSTRGAFRTSSARGRRRSRGMSNVCPSTQRAFKDPGMYLVWPLCRPRAVCHQKGVSKWG